MSIYVRTYIILHLISPAYYPCGVAQVPCTSVAADVSNNETTGSFPPSLVIYAVLAALRGTSHTALRCPSEASGVSQMSWIFLCLTHMYTKARSSCHIVRFLVSSATKDRYCKFLSTCLDVNSTPLEKTLERDPQSLSTLLVIAAILVATSFGSRSSILTQVDEGAPRPFYPWGAVRRNVPRALVEGLEASSVKRMRSRNMA
ncbi:hypothetical protein F5Y12DRAFT_692823 [Xylaria sp. FL1777]|nr:hypothetical protein F5Y12DRAFT_692823 [Xylaria sp. FL1777]